MEDDSILLEPSSLELELEEEDEIKREQFVITCRVEGRAGFAVFGPYNGRDEADKAYNLAFYNLEKNANSTYLTSCVIRKCNPPWKLIKFSKKERYIPKIKPVIHDNESVVEDEEQEPQEIRMERYLQEQREQIEKVLKDEDEIKQERKRQIEQDEKKFAEEQVKKKAKYSLSYWIFDTRILSFIIPAKESGQLDDTFLSLLPTDLLRFVQTFLQARLYYTTNCKICHGLSGLLNTYRIRDDEFRCFDCNHILERIQSYLIRGRHIWEALNVIPDVVFTQPWWEALEVEHQTAIVDYLKRKKK